MKHTHLIAVLIGFAAISVFTTNASAYYHPTMGRFISRDPGPGGGSAAPVTDSRFIPRDPTGTNQYADGMNLYQYVRSGPTRRMDPSGLMWISGPGEYASDPRTPPLPEPNTDTQGVYIYDRRSGQEAAKDGRSWRYQWATGCGTCTEAHKTMLKDVLWHAIHKIVYAQMDVRWISRDDVALAGSSAYRRLSRYGLLINPGSTLFHKRQVRKFGKKLDNFVKNLFANDNISIACDYGQSYQYDTHSGTKRMCSSTTVALAYRGDGSVEWVGGRHAHKIFLCSSFFSKGWHGKIRTLIHEFSHRYMNTTDDLGAQSDVYFNGTNYWSANYPGSTIGSTVPGAGFAQYQNHADTVAWTISQWGS